MMPEDSPREGKRKIVLDWQDCDFHNPPSGVLLLVWSGYFNHADSAVFYGNQCQIKDITHWAHIPQVLEPEDYDNVDGPES